jgi:hypothetical protein
MNESQKFDRYLKISKWLQARYTALGMLVLSVGGVPSQYSKLESLAYDRYVAESERDNEDAKDKAFGPEFPAGEFNPALIY